jgi:hypothetical protein
MRIIRIPGKSYADRIRKNAEVFIQVKEEPEEELRVSLFTSEPLPFIESPTETFIDRAAINDILSVHTPDSNVEIVVEFLGGGETNPFVIATFYVQPGNIQWRMDGFNSVLELRDLSATVTRSGMMTRVNYIRRGDIIFSTGPETFNLSARSFVVGDTINVSNLTINFTLG